MLNQTLVGFVRKELAQAVRDPRMRVMLFLMPVIQMTLFGLALSNEVRNIKLKVIRDPSDQLAREIEERALASNWFVPANTGTGSVDPFDLVHSGRADAVLIMPPGGLSKTYGRNNGQIQLLVDASNAVRGRAIETYMQAVLAKTSLLAPLVSPEKGGGGFSFDVRMLYNPSMETAIFLVPGVMCLILCLLSVVLTSMSIAREKEMGTLETLIAAPVQIWEVILGKTIPYIFIGLLDVPLVLGVAVFLFGVPMRGQVFVLFLASLAFLCAAVATGTLISTFAENQQQAMMGGFLFMFPAIQLSGVMFPLDNIPAAISWVPYLNPLKYYVVLLRNIMLKGGDAAVIWPNMGALVGLAAIMVIKLK
jgi:ABC-2 type transport system permease protein